MEAEGNDRRGPAGPAAAVAALRIFVRRWPCSATDNAVLPKKLTIQVQRKANTFECPILFLE